MTFKKKSKSELIDHIKFLEEMYIVGDSTEKLFCNYIKTKLPFSREQEFFSVIFTDNKFQVLGHKVLFVGSSIGSDIDVRLIYKSALKKKGCTHIIIAHNHPTGDVTPSQNDVAITKRIYEAGLILGIIMIDSIVYSKTTYKSVRYKTKDDE